MEPKNIENHKFLPSGYWKGFYLSDNSSIKHKMSIILKFSNKIVSGSSNYHSEVRLGSDAVLSNNIRGPITTNISQPHVRSKREVEKSNVAFRDALIRICP